MNKDELKEAIAATITENGQKGITGQALANLLNEIVDSAGVAVGGNGGLTITCSFDTVTGGVTSAPNEVNAQVYKTIMDGLNNGIAYPLNIIVDTSEAIEGSSGFICLADLVAPPADYNGLGIISIGMSIIVSKFEGFILQEDGSIIVPVEESSSDE
jgi:hypothetical protein